MIRSTLVTLWALAVVGFAVLALVPAGTGYVRSFGDSLLVSDSYHALFSVERGRIGLVYASKTANVVPLTDEVHRFLDLAYFRRPFLSGVSLGVTLGHPRTWAVAALTLPLFVRTATRFLRRRARRRRGHCRKCGYNLTGLPEPRCPECGRGFDRRDTEG